MTLKIIRNSLVFKLMGAFLLVIIIGALVVSVLASRETTSAFSLYATRNGRIWAQRLAPILADYYSQNGSWDGVNTVFHPETGDQYSTMTGENGMGMYRGIGMGGRQAIGVVAAVEHRIILADHNGIVVSDSTGELVGQKLPEASVDQGVPIFVQKILAGTLIVLPNNQIGVNTPATEFLASVNRAIITSAIIAGSIAILVGLVLFFQITAPLQQLRKAATAIAHGDLTQRVKIHSHDELGELGTAFNQMAENLSHSEIQRNHLMADIAHELRTPLTAIQGTLEGIQDGILPLDSEQVTALYAETTLLNRLVGDLRLLSIAETGQLKLDLQTTDIGKLIAQVAERARSQAQTQNIILQTGISDNLPFLVVDPDRIIQVLNNLIANALRYTPEGGSITIQCNHPSELSSVEISITDTGPGIDPENLGYIFDRFYRADKSRARTSGGSGLGLAIVKQLVEAHDGNVKAQSPVFYNKNNRGFGTRFIVKLPLH